MIYQNLKKHLINSFNILKRFALSLTPPLFGGFFFLVCFISFLGLRHNQMEDNLLQSTKIVLKIEESKSECLSNVYHFNGITRAIQNITLKSDLSGPVFKIMAKAGQPIKKGDAILKIHNDDLDAKLESARARFQQKDLEFKASEKLNAKGVKTQIDLTQSKAEMELARSELAKMEGHIIKAPDDGYIDAFLIDEKDQITPQTGLVKFLKISPLKIIIYISEKEHDLIKEGQKATLNIPILKKAVEGIVTFISKSPTEETKTYEINIETPNTDQSILDGMSCDVRIEELQKLFHKIPLSALTLNNEGVTGIKIINEESKVEFLKIEKHHIQDNGFLFVATDKENFHYIKTGASFVEEGQKVDIVTGKIL
ncbi:MAG: efflux RND transporter periplasmic adaptor subunit [Proteobacteria bacterium]|nr:efflux RND transporter periplasmic adaptor subunit [Pseudomonadota bacterium]